MRPSLLVQRLSCRQRLERLMTSLTLEVVDQIPFGKALEAAAAANQIIEFKIGRFVAPHSA